MNSFYLLSYDSEFRIHTKSLVDASRRVGSFGSFSACGKEKGLTMRSSLPEESEGRRKL